MGHLIIANVYPDARTRGVAPAVSSRQWRRAFDSEGSLPAVGRYQLFRLLGFEPGRRGDRAREWDAQLPCLRVGLRTEEMLPAVWQK